jgi:hypothetical protein
VFDSSIFEAGIFTIFPIPITEKSNKWYNKGEKNKGRIPNGVCLIVHLFCNCNITKNSMSVFVNTLDVFIAKAVIKSEWRNVLKLNNSFRVAK